MSHDMPVIPLPVPQNLWSRSLRDLDHRFEQPKVLGVLRTGVETNIPKPDQIYPRSGLKVGNNYLVVCKSFWLYFPIRMTQTTVQGGGVRIIPDGRPREYPVPPTPTLDYLEIGWRSYFFAYFQGFERQCTEYQYILNKKSGECTKYPIFSNSNID